MTMTMICFCCSPLAVKILNRKLKKKLIRCKVEVENSIDDSKLDGRWARKKSFTSLLNRRYVII